MDEVVVETVADPELEAPILIEGLPGVGHVGKLAADYLIEEQDGDLVRRIYSEHFPPHVTIDSSGHAHLAGAEFYSVSTANRDVLVLLGDYQATHGVGHYRLTNAFLDVAESFDVAEIIALGGVPTGELVQDHSVIGALTEGQDRDRFEAAGVEFRTQEPAGGIVGTSGLLLGLGGRRDLPAACLMGETSGYLVDPGSAKAVLETLEAIFDFTLDYSALESRAEEMEEFIRQFQDEQQGGGQTEPTDEDLRYFG